MADKVRQALPFFRRRSSSNISHEEDLIDTKQQYEKLQELYTLAVDELNYAEDSQGSSYYSGDLTTARDALDDCANAFLFILQHIPESEARECLQTAMTPKLFQLQIRLDALPEPDDAYDY
ncbi:hypothetical protein K501DRAFT_283801 [Backusella circina FSU 941]|nr:hypothetical protein K501DRAFT_283801 [Backusella circina FSU 941]